MSTSNAPDRPTLGWREWVGLPDLGIETVKAKVDTGARTSSLHAHDIEEFTRDERAFVRFRVHSEQRNTRFSVQAEARLVERRRVIPSSGHAEWRPVIRTTLEILGEAWEIEVTLTSRDVMGFRMLIGRRAVRRRFLVDPDTSFTSGRRVKGTKRLKE